MRTTEKDAFTDHPPTPHSNLGANKGHGIWKNVRSKVFHQLHRLLRIRAVVLFTDMDQRKDAGVG